MERVKHIDPLSSSTISQLVKAMKEVGVLGAGRLGRATAILSEIFQDPECFTFLSMSGPMVPGGMRRIISHLVEEGYIDGIVTSGANIVHDLIEGYGGAHYKFSEKTTDTELREARMGRVADIVVDEKDFEIMEKEIYQFLDNYSANKMTGMAPSEFLEDLGRSLSDDESILKVAANSTVPIFCPGLMDSMLGLHLYTYSTTNTFSLDFVKDLRILGEIVKNTNKIGAIILGGGLAKHFTMGSTILKGGLDLAIQITLDRPEAGSLGGAPLGEGISWQKVQTSAKYETVIGDATIVFPLMVIGAISSGSMKSRDS